MFHPRNLQISRKRRHNPDLLNVGLVDVLVFVVDMLEFLTSVWELEDVPVNSPPATPTLRAVKNE